MRIVYWRQDGDITVTRCGVSNGHPLPTEYKIIYSFGRDHDDVQLEAIPGYLVIDGIAFRARDDVSGSFYYPSTQFLERQDEYLYRHPSNVDMSISEPLDLSRWDGVNPSNVCRWGTIIHHMSICDKGVMAYCTTDGVDTKCIIPSPLCCQCAMDKVVFSNTDELTICIMSREHICIASEKGDMPLNKRSEWLTYFFFSSRYLKSRRAKKKVLGLGINKHRISIIEEDDSWMSSSNVIPVIASGSLIKAAR